MRLHLVCGKEGCAYVKLLGNRYDCDLWVPCDSIHPCRWISAFIIHSFVCTCTTLGSPYSIFWFYFFVIPLYVICVSVILNCTYVMWTRLCIIIIVLLQFHFGFRFAVSILVLHAVNTCCVLWRILLRWCYDIMISPLRILVINFLKSIPHRAVGASLFWCCCCYSRCCFLRGCVIIFVQFLILRSLLSVVGACLFLWWPGTYLLYTIVCLVATLGDRTLSWVRFDWCFVLITGITRTSFVVVPRKL